MFRSQGAHVYPLILKTWHCSDVFTGLKKQKRDGFQIKQKRFDLTKGKEKKKSYKMYTILNK